VTSTILSGCYNTLIARNWEAGRMKDEMLVPHISRAVEFARADQRFAESEYGFKRRARIRLAHVGELAAYPKFANWLGRTIQTVSEGTVDGILYTRHPNIRELDASALVLNLTVDESSRKRLAWSRKGVRIVWSAWNGMLDPTAEVNFLEHHDHGQHAEPIGEGSICPVTASSTEHRFCDAHYCTKCFDDPTLDPVEPELIRDTKKLGIVRTRTQTMLSEASQDGSS